MTRHDEETEIDWGRRSFVASLTVISMIGATAISGRANANGNWQRVGSVDTIKAVPVQKATVGGTVLYLHADQSGQIVAYSAKCTHMGCTIDWKNDQNQFACPCHGGRFDISGTNIGGPPKRPLDKLEVRVAADKTVYVKISD